MDHRIIEVIPRDDVVPIEDRPRPVAGGFHRDGAPRHPQSNLGEALLEFDSCALAFETISPTRFSKQCFLRLAEARTTATGFEVLSCPTPGRWTSPPEDFWITLNGAKQIARF